MSYSQKLKDPRWQRRRLEMLSLHDWTCNCCGAQEKTLHVHHKAYLPGREPWEYDAGQLDVLCEECHSYQHECMDGIKEELSKLNMTSCELLCVLRGLNEGYSGQKFQGDWPSFVGQVVAALIPLPMERCVKVLGVVADEWKAEFVGGSK